MDIHEVLSEKNYNKTFLCESNGFLVKNDNGVLVYKQFNNQNWKNCILTLIWLNAKYTKAEEYTIKD